MSKFESVSVVKAANVYFDGNVTSRSVEFADGSLKTLGIMLPGEYKFNTGKPELMEIQSGDYQMRQTSQILNKGGLGISMNHGPCGTSRQR